MDPLPADAPRILLSGSSGAIGQALTAALPSDATVARLIRPGRAPTGRSIVWDPEAGTVDGAALREFAPTDIIHLAGENVFGRWTADKKRRIHDSRIRGTDTLARALAALEPRPRSFLSASAVGYYGDRQDEPLTESAPPGEGFLADVCREWEAVAAPAAQAGIRVAHLRIGVVLDAASGALRTMLPVYRLGLGGPIAGGRTWIPWITLHDTAATIIHILSDQAIAGAVNVVSPTPVTQAEFARALGRRLHRPAVVPVPRAVLTLAMGEFARETALKSVRALPAALLASGFRFTHPDLDLAFAAIL